MKSLFTRWLVTVMLFLPFRMEAAPSDHDAEADKESAYSEIVVTLVDEAGRRIPASDKLKVVFFPANGKGKITGLPQIDGYNFRSGSLPLGDYYIGVEPDESLDYMPSFYPNVLSRQSAEVITLSETGLSVLVTLYEKSKTSDTTDKTDNTVPETTVKLEVYPNPVSDRLQIKGLDIYGTNTVRLLDMTGRAVILEKTTDAELTMQVDYLPAGIYVLHVDTGNTTVIRKIIKR